jgi:hypothetical protein
MSVHTHFVSRFLGISLVNAVSCANRDAAAAAADSSLRGENIVNINSFLQRLLLSWWCGCGGNGG